MIGSLLLDVASWAAVVVDDSAEQFGMAGDASVIPDGQRRRLPAFARDLIRCTVPLFAEAPRRPLILAAPFGDMQSTAKLLTDLANNEILSPALFALSVHNAGPGAMSLVLAEPGDQTALAGNGASLHAALLEAYARLAVGDEDAVVVAYAQPKLPAIYAEQDEPAPGVFLSLLLRAVADSSQQAIDVAYGRAGVIDVVRSLDSGARRLRFALPQARTEAA